jgi:hypothetical protein
VILGGVGSSSQPRNLREKVLASVCTQVAMDNDYCHENDLNKFIVSVPTDLEPGANILSFSDTFPQFNKSMSLSRVDSVDKMGVYCVRMEAVDEATPQYQQEFTATVAFKNPYGLLPAADYPLLPVRTIPSLDACFLLVADEAGRRFFSFSFYQFNGALSLVYLVIGLAWFVKSAMHWREILMIQVARCKA